MPDPTKPPSQADRISANVAAMRSQGASESDIESYLSQHEGLSGTPTVGTPESNTYHARFQSGQLLKQVARANANDAVDLADEPSPFRATAERVAQHALNTAQGFPGGTLAETGLEQIGNLAFGTHRPQTADEALAAVRGATPDISLPVDAAEKFAGAVASAPLMGFRVPGMVGKFVGPTAAKVLTRVGSSPIAQSAEYGGLSGLADPDQNVGLESRGKEAVAKGATDAAVTALGMGMGAAGSAVGRRFISPALGMDARVGAALKQAIGKAAPVEAPPAGASASPLQSVSGFDVLPAAPEATPSVVQATVANTPHPTGNLAQAVEQSAKPSIDDLLGNAFARHGWTPAKGPFVGDAELAMGLNKVGPRLEDLLRQSIVNNGGTPVTAP